MSAPVAWLVQSCVNPASGLLKSERPKPQREKFRTQAEAEARKAKLLQSGDDSAVCITPVYPKQQQPVLSAGDSRDWRLKP